MKIIVTGGAGFIGANFIYYMLGKYPDYKIICVDCLTYAGNTETLKGVWDNPKFCFIKSDITDRAAMENTFSTLALYLPLCTVLAYRKMFFNHPHQHCQHSLRFPVFVGIKFLHYF